MTLLRRLFPLAIVLLPLAAPHPAPAQDAAGSEDEDRGWLTGLIEDNLSGEGRTVRLEGFKGAFSSRATFDSLTISDADGAWLTIKDAAVQLNRAALLRRQVVINDLSAAEIDLPRLPPASPGAEAPAAEATPFSLPELPVSLQVDHISAARVLIGQPVFGQEVHLSLEGSARLADGDGSAKLEVNRLDGPRGRISLTAGYENATGQTSVDLLVDEAADGIVATQIGLPGAPAIQLAVNGSGPISDFTADLALSSDNQPRLTGQVHLGSEPFEGAGATTQEGGGAAAPAQVQRFSVDLSGDIAPLFLPEYQDFFGSDIRLQAQGARQPDGAMQLSQLDLASRALSLSGTAAIGADGVPDFVDFNATLGLDDRSEVLLPVGSPTWLKHADLALTFDAGISPDWHLDGNVDGLRREDVSLAALKLAGSGQMAAVPAADGSAGTSFTGDVSFDATGLSAADAALAAAIGDSLAGRAHIETEPDQPVKVSGLQLNGADYGLAGDLAFNGFDQAMEIAGQLTARVEDASRFSALAGQELSGAARVSVDGTYGVLAGSFDAKLDLVGDDLGAGIEPVDNLLKGRATAHLDAARDATGTTIRDFALKAATLTASASGKLSSQASDVTAKVDFADLGVMGGPYGGRFSATAGLSGQGKVQNFTVDGRGQDVTLGIPELDGLLAGESTVAVEGSRSGSAITLTVARVNTPAISLSGAGTYDPGRSDLTARIDFPSVGVMGPAYGGSLTAEAHLQETGTAKAPVRQLTLTGKAQDLAVGVAEANRVLAGTTDIDLAAEEKAGAIRIERLNLTNPQLQVKADGVADGETRRVNLDARLNNLALVVPGFPGPLSVKGSIDELDGQGYRLDLAATGPGETDATVSGTTAADFSTLDLAVKGSAQSALANAFIAPQSVTGPVRFDLQLDGPPGLSALSGRISTQGARFSVPAAGLTLEQIAAQVDLSGGRAQIQTTANVANGGRISLRGPVGLEAPNSANLTVQLNNVVLRDPALYETSLDGTVTIDGPLAGGAKIAGAIALGETEIQVPSTGFGSGGLVEGLEHRGESAPVRATRARAGLLESEGEAAGDSGGGASYGLDLRISAPKRIFVRGRGLDAELGGQLRVLGTTDNVQPQGQFELVRGRLDILAHRFNLDQGIIQMQGSLVPTILFSASSQTDTDTASIIIEGPASDPEIRFESANGLPEEEVLAQLLFGQDMDKITPFQAAQLASAVATLAGRGTSVFDKVRQGLGLDNLDVTQDDEGNASVSAGRYLTDNIYSDVTVGAQGTSSINLNLDVSRNVTLRGSAKQDGNSSVGVYFERDY